jgi:hypothetical protein
MRAVEQGYERWNLSSRGELDAPMPPEPATDSRSDRLKRLEIRRCLRASGSAPAVNHRVGLAGGLRDVLL